jgi:hypothetical protein
MAISTIGTASSTISGTATSLVGTNKNFNAKVGDILTSTSANGGVFYNGTSLYNSGSSASSLVPTQPVSSFTVLPVPQYATFNAVAVSGVTGYVTSIAGDGNTTVLIGHNTASQTTLKYSTNSGATWSSTGTLPSTTWNLVVYNANATQWIAYATGSTANPYYSTNLTGAWSLSTGGNWATPANAIVAGGGNIVAYPTSTTGINYSSNGSSWTAGSLPITSNAMRYVNNQFIAWDSTGTNYKGTFYTSPTGATWTARTFGGSIPLDFLYFNGVYYLISNYIYSSTDAITWTSTGISGGSVINFTADKPIISDGKYLVQGAGVGTFPNNFVATIQPTVNNASFYLGQTYCAGSGTFVVGSGSNGYVVTYTWGLTNLGAGTTAPAFSLTNTSQTTYAGTI